MQRRVRAEHDNRWMPCGSCTREMRSPAQQLMVKPVTRFHTGCCATSSASPCIPAAQAEAGKVSFYHRAAARQQQLQAAWLAKRRQENAARRAQGEDPLPEEEPGLFKPLPEPSQLDNVLIANQIDACVSPL